MFEKLWQMIKKRGFILPLAIVVSIIVFCINPYNILSFAPDKISGLVIIALFFSSSFIVVYRVLLWFRRRVAIAKLEKEEQENQDMEIAKRIRDTDFKITEVFFECYSQDTNKIPRTEELDYLIYCHSRLRIFFEPEEDYYIVNQRVLNAIKKYHRIAFRDIYWSNDYKKTTHKNP